MNALKARHLYQKDRDYLVQGDKIVLLDKNTGRALPNNVLGDNLHAALQAKEGLPCEQQQQDQGRIHTPGFYSMYHKLCAMTGTAGVGTLSEKELQEVYGLTTVQIPTNKPIQRVDHPVVIYATKAEKYAAAVDAVRQAHAQGRPVLLGVTSIPEGNDVSAMLTEAGIPHKLLTAQNEADEAKIVAEAGRLGAVTVATDMAGRGTDILLGGTAEEYRAAAMNDPEQGSTTLTIRKVMRYYYGGPLIPQEFYNAFLRIIGSKRINFRARTAWNGCWTTTLCPSSIRRVSSVNRKIPSTPRLRQRWNRLCWTPSARKRERQYTAASTKSRCGCGKRPGRHPRRQWQLLRRAASRWTTCSILRCSEGSSAGGTADHSCLYTLQL